MITRRGIGLLIVAIVGFFVASATRVGWLHLADAVLAGSLVVSAVLPQICVARLRASAKFSPRGRTNAEVTPVVGDPAGLSLSLHNEAPVPRLFVSATVLSDQVNSRFFVAGIPARGSASLSTDISCRSRGWLSLDQVTLECRAPFGLFRARRRPPTSARLLVYPFWYPLRQLRLLDVLGGDHSGRRPARRGDEVAGSRRYVAGDAMRDMHWKNTARTGRPTVKEFDAGIEESLAIAFETGAVLGEGSENTLEYSVTIAASVGRAMMARGGETQLALGESDREIFYDWPEMMKRLALLQQSTTPTLSDALRNAEPGSRVLAIVSGAQASNVSAVVAAAHRGVSIAAVLLEGFAGDDAGSGPPMAQAGVPVVACRRGQMGSAMEAIERGIVEGVADRWQRAGVDRDNGEIKAREQVA